MLSLPVVSCVMPTADRRRFVPRAVEQFLAQDHEPRELIVLDDGVEPVGDLIPHDPRILYERLPARLVLGAKRNLGCEMARGEIIAHWDDDDWYAPQRLRVQVEALQAQPGALLCGLSALLFRDPSTGRTWRYTYPASERRPWVAGASMLYRRSLWERTRFQAVMSGEDTRFAWAAARHEVVMLRSDALMVATVHDRNTSSKRMRSSRWQQVDARLVADVPGFAMPPGTPPAPAADRPVRVASAAHPPGAGATPAALPRTRQRTRPRDAAPARTPAVAVVQESPAVTACLLSWKRPHHLPRIVERLRCYPFIRRILVWNNNPAVDLRLPGEDVEVIPAGRNHGCYGRYLCAARSQTDLVYTQDDDALVHNADEVLAAHLEQPDLMAHGLTPKHYAARGDLVFGSAQLGWLGWGAVFDRSWLALLDDLPADVRGSRLFEREADVYFSIMLGRPHRSIRGHIDHLPGHSRRGEAVYRDPEAESLRADAIRHALALSRQAHRPDLPPLWNVVVTSHSYGLYLRESVTSVLRNHGDVVVTIVDDGSTDGTAQVAGDLVRTHPGVQVVTRPTRGGAAVAANSGIARGDSAYVVRLDADDRIGPRYLRAAEVVLAAGADVANPDAILFGDERGRWPTPERTSLTDLLQHNRVHCAAAFRRSLWAEVGGFTEDLPKWIDYDFWLRVASRGARIRRCPGDHFYYRRHASSLSRSGPSPDEMRGRIRQIHSGLYASRR